MNVYFYCTRQVYFLVFCVSPLILCWTLSASKMQVTYKSVPLCRHRQSTGAAVALLTCCSHCASLYKQCNRRLQLQSFQCKIPSLCYTATVEQGNTVQGNKREGFVMKPWKILIWLTEASNELQLNFHAKKYDWILTPISSTRESLGGGLFMASRDIRNG